MLNMVTYYHFKKNYNEITAVATVYNINCFFLRFVLVNLPHMMKSRPKLRQPLKVLWREFWATPRTKLSLATSFPTRTLPSLTLLPESRWTTISSSSSLGTTTSTVTPTGLSTSSNTSRPRINFAVQIRC